MYTETKECIMHRIERMRLRFLNAGCDVLSECTATKSEIEVCETVAECLEKEKLLVQLLDERFPATTQDVNAAMRFGNFQFRYTDARYDSRSQLIA